MQAEPLVLPPVCCYTGRVAAWAPFPQPAAAHSADGLPPLKTSSPGVWLRSDAGGVLTVQWRPDAPPLLTCTLRSSQQLVRAPLRRGGFAFRLLCPAHGAPVAAAGGSSGHVLFLSLPQPAAAGSGSMLQPAGQQARTATIALHFDTPQAGRECGALLQAIHQDSLSVVAAPGQPAQAAPAAHTAAKQAAAAVAGAARDKAAAGAEMAAGGTAATAAAAANGGWDELFGYPDEAALEAAIQARCMQFVGWAVGGTQARLGLLMADGRCVWQAAWCPLICLPAPFDRCACQACKERWLALRSQPCDAAPRLPCTREC